jgi:hypothetical protein
MSDLILQQAFEYNSMAVINTLPLSAHRPSTFRDPSHFDILCLGQIMRAVRREPSSLKIQLAQAHSLSHTRDFIARFNAA